MTRLAAATRIGIVLAAACCLAGDAAPVAAQVRAPRQPPAGGGRILVAASDAPVDEQARIHPPTDRILTRGMRRAQESIARGEFAEATSFLDELLGRDEDYFFETNDHGGFAGLKETARQLIRDLPPEGRRAYEAAFNPIAERELRRVGTEGDIAALEQVVQRYFYTPAGYQAALLLATAETDAGRHLTAALLYQQLLDTPAAARRFDPELSIRAAASWLAAEDADQALRVLEALRSRGRATIEIGGRQHSFDAPADPLAWLRTTVGEPTDAAETTEREWLTYRGNASRNGETAGGLPHMRVRWRAALLRSYMRLEELFEEYQAELVQSDRSTPVASAPLAAGDYVLVRSPLELVAVDFRTGKRVWRSELQHDAQLEQLMRSGRGADEDANNVEAAQSFVRRVWEDYLYGVTSSDGARVFVIRDLPMPAAQDYELSQFMSIPGPEASSPTNRLTAYDLATEGTLAWEIDGAVVEGDLAGAFFLGAPLAMGPSLYVLVEIRDDIYLAALDRENGQLQWRQQLANLETGVVLDLRRRLQAVMPSYDSGMLVCPTGAGLVVGVDLAKRSLAWAYRYETISPFDEDYADDDEVTANGLTDRWTDGAAMIADGRVLITPPESGELHCLDLRTGNVLWTLPRGEMQRLACIDEGRLLLVGTRRLTALRLDDGKPAWTEIELSLPRDAAPAGNGFLSDGMYYFPLTTGEVVAVDLAQGRLSERVQARDGAVLGNLICYRGAVISQNGSSLDCFDQVDVLRARSERQLAEDSDNVEALRSLGEIAYNEGRLSEALDLVERAYRQSPKDLETRDMLALCLADALDENFATYRARLPLLHELEQEGVVDPLQALRIEAQGLLAVGELEESAAACFRLYRAAVSVDQPLVIGQVHETAVSRWVQSQMAAIWDAATPAQREALAEKVRREAPDLDAAVDAEQLPRFLSFFGSLPEFDAYKLACARQLEAEQRWLESQQLLLDLVHSPDDSVRGEAVARIAAALHAAKLGGMARDFDEQLAGQFASVACLDGATGRELLESWADDEGAADASWPTGRVEWQDVATGGDQSVRPRAPVWGVRLEHGDSILARGVGFLARGGEISWQDNQGREFFNDVLQSESQALYRQPGSAYGASRGSLLIVSLGRELAAFNTLPAPDGEAQRQAWRVSLGGNFDYEDAYLDEMSRETAPRPGSFRAPRSRLDGRWVGVIGPITSGGFIYQDQRRLVCIDPVTGETRWSRTDAPPGCDLFGDDRYVFVTPSGSETAWVYSAIDGRSLGRTTLPPWDEQLTRRGRLVIRWSQTEEGGMELAAVDALTSDVAWRRQFAADSFVDFDRQKYVAVVEAEGRAVILDVDSGEALVEHAVSRQSSVEQIHLLAGDASFALMIEQRRSRDAGRIVRPFVSDNAPVVDGQLIVIDRAAGKMLWNRPADVVQQALVIDQPADLPLVIFAGTLTSRSEDNRGDATMVLLLDKATGRTIFQTDDWQQPGPGYCLARVSDPAKHEVTVELAGRSLLLQFTDDRRPPEPPLMAEVELDVGGTSRGILGIIHNLGGAE
jgi:outer membrane protein assembly factor BamB